MVKEIKRYFGRQMFSFCSRNKLNTFCAESFFAQVSALKRLQIIYHMMCCKQYFWIAKFQALFPSWKCFLAHLKINVYGGYKWAALAPASNASWKIGSAAAVVVFTTIRLQIE